MTDETYTFMEHQRSTKAMASGARHRVCGSKSKKCTMPSDYMTAAQKRRMNGPVSTIQLSSPMTWAELTGKNSYLQYEYLDNLLHKRGFPASWVADMLGVSQATLKHKLDQLNVKSRKPGGKPSCSLRREWMDFIDPEGSPEEASESLAVADPEIVPALPGIVLRDVSFTVTAGVAPFLNALRPLIGCVSIPAGIATPDDVYEFTIHAVRKEN